MVMARKQRYLPLARTQAELSGITAFYIPACDRWLDLYFQEEHRVPGFELALYWDDNNEIYTKAVSYSNVCLAVSYMMDPDNEAEVKERHSIKT